MMSTNWSLRLIAAFLFAALPGTSPAASLVVTLTVDDHRAGRTPAQVSAVHSEKGDSRITASAVAPGSVTLEILEKGVWYVEVEAEGFWSEPRPVVIQDSSQTTEIVLWRAAALRGTVTSEAKMPNRLKAELRTSPGSSRQGMFTIDCGLSGSAFQCSVPSGTFDLSLRVAGHAAVYLWDTEIKPEKETALIPIKLSSGPSLVGFVKTARNIPDDKKRRVEVALLPAGVRIPDSGEAPGTKRMTPNHRGFFQFLDLRAGAYLLRGSAAGLVSAEREVVIYADVEAELREPLLLDKPKTLEVHVSPELDPWGRPWTISVARLDRKTMRERTAAESVLTETGMWKSSTLPPGEYNIRIRRHAGDAWLSTAIVVDEDRRVDLGIPVTKLLGSLKLAGKPLKGTIWLGGDTGAVSIPVGTDADGKFRTIVPQVPKNHWPVVDVVAEQPPVNRRLEGLDLRTSDDGIARLDIDLPAGALSGDVVDEAGKPVARAFVSIKTSGNEPLLQVVADEAGTFSLNGLPVGTVTLRAEGKDGHSDTVDVEIAESEEMPNVVRLVVHSDAVVEGIVLSQSGTPVAGARLAFVFSGALYSTATSSDTSGRFRQALGPGVSEATVVVSAPGFAGRIIRTAIEKGRLLEIHVTQSGGTLITDVPVSARSKDERPPLIVHGDAGILLGFLEFVHPPHVTEEGQRVLKAFFMETGVYQLCSQADRECRSGFLAQGSELMLAVPGAR